MSTFHRLASGSVASWSRILLNLIVQFFLVPVYLRYWSPDQYGAWLAIWAFIGLVNSFSLGFHGYLGNEFYKYAHSDRERMWALFYSGIKSGFLILFFEIVVLILILFVFRNIEFFGLIYGTSGLAFVVVIYALVWALCFGFAGIAVRLLTALGYYPRMAWWGVVSGIIVAVVPAIAAVFGAGIVGAIVSVCIATIVYNIPFHCDIWGLLRREGILMGWRSARWIWREAFCSLVITARGFFETIRQQGVRLVISPLLAPSSIASFSTMRTGANIALQGINSISFPVIPDLMRFIHQKDQERCEATFSAIWLIVAVVLAPCLILFQAIVPLLYNFWTLGRLSFDPLTFSMLSLGVVIYSIAQPAMSIVSGNNLLRPQILVGFLSAITAVGCMVVFVPIWGLSGVGFSLLLAEALAAIEYTRSAIIWMKRHGLYWPMKSQFWMICVFLNCSIFSLAIAVLPQFDWIFVAAGTILSAFVARGYWASMPLLARLRLLGVINKIKVVLGAAG